MKNFTNIKPSLTLYQKAVDNLTTAAVLRFIEDFSKADFPLLFLKDYLVTGIKPNPDSDLKLVLQKNSAMISEGKEVDEVIEDLKEILEIKFNSHEKIINYGTTYQVVINDHSTIPDDSLRNCIEVLSESYEINQNKEKKDQFYRELMASIVELSTSTNIEQQKKKDKTESSENPDSARSSDSNTSVSDSNSSFGYFSEDLPPIDPEKLKGESPDRLLELLLQERQSRISDRRVVEEAAKNAIAPFVDKASESRQTALEIQNRFKEGLSGDPKTSPRKFQAANLQVPKDTSHSLSGQ